MNLSFRLPSRFVGALRNHTRKYLVILLFTLPALLVLLPYTNTMMFLAMASGLTAGYSFIIYCDIEDARNDSSENNGSSNE